MSNGPEAKNTSESPNQEVENIANKFSDKQKEEVGDDFDKACEQSLNNPKDQTNPGIEGGDGLYITSPGIEGGGGDEIYQHQNLNPKYQLNSGTDGDGADQGIDGDGADQGIDGDGADQGIDGDGTDQGIDGYGTSPGIGRGDITSPGIDGDEKPFKNKQESLNNKNYLLLQQSQDIIDKLLDKQDLFKNITYFFEHFTQPQSGSSLQIVNSPLLSQNGRDNVSRYSTINTSSSQKKEIIKAFLTIPADILATYIQDYNQKFPSKKIDGPMLSDINQYSNQYLSIQKQLSQNQASILANQKLSFPKSKEVDLASNQESQKIGKLFELPLQEQISIQNNLDMIQLEYKQYSISNINLIGYADATPVTPNGKKIIQGQFSKHINLLNQKGFDTSNLPNNYDDFPKRLVSNNYIKSSQLDNSDLVANRGFAFTRAIMQLSRMSPDQAKNFKDSSLNLDIQTSDKKGDQETRGGIVFAGIGTKTSDSPKEKFELNTQSPEILMNNDFTIATNIGGEIKIFKFQKSDKINSDGTVSNINALNSLIDQGTTGTHGNIKDYASNHMKDKLTHYQRGNFGGPVFYINLKNDPDNPTIQKIIQSSGNNPQNIPSVQQFLGLYQSLLSQDQSPKDLSKQNDLISRYQKIYGLAQ